MSRPAVDMLIRFWEKVDISVDGCWLWTGSTTPQGYGRFTINRATRNGAHRVAYELLVGPIPDGLDLDHLCCNPPCVRPDHLEPVTRSENMRRAYAVRSAAGITRLNHHAAKTHCKRGHEFDVKNTLYAHGARYCRACRAAAYQARKAASNGGVAS